MKRLIGLLYLGSFALTLCFVLESEAATSKSVSENDGIFAYELGDLLVADFDFAEVTPENLMLKDYSFTYVVEGRSYKSINKNIPAPSCRSPGYFQNRRF